jgi:hypothetical protein
VPLKDGINYRRAQPEDAFAIMNLYQVACAGTPDDPVLLNYRALVAELNSPLAKWLVADKDGQIVAAFSLMLDLENRLGKMNRVVLHPHWEDSVHLMREALPLLIGYLQGQVEVLYTTTRYLNLEQQELTLQMGFKLLGIFPNAMGADTFRVNGLSAYFFDGLLTNRRFATFKMHPVVAPFYETVRKQCGLEPMELYAPEAEPKYETVPVPPLEILFAPRFVSDRFESLREKKSIAIHFYPFQEPNALITGLRQKVEIFVKVIPEMRFAAIIGERLDHPVDPTELYQQVSLLLNRHNITYIEMINDAGDSRGIDCLLKAGYLPVAYFPCFKRQGERRRDYVILSRSFDRLFAMGPIHANVNPLYVEYLTNYFRLEEKASLDPFCGSDAKQ